MPLSNPWLAPLEQLQREILDLIDQQTETQWGWSPSQKVWPVARTVDHINTVNGLVVPRLEEAIRLGWAQNLTGAGPFRYPLFDRLFVFGLEPRAPVKQSAPGIYVPDERPALHETRARFIDLQARLIKCTRSAEGLDLVRIKVPSPVSARLRFSLGTWFSASMAHEQNHFEQALRLVRLPDFPSAG